MPEAQFTHRAEAAVSPERAWERLQDPATWATVAGVDSTSEHHHVGGRLQGFRFATTIGGIAHQGSAAVEESRPSEAMTLTIGSNELTGTIAVGLVPASDGTVLEVVMTMRPAGLMGSLVFPVVSGAVGSGFAESVERLAASL